MHGNYILMHKDKPVCDCTFTDGFLVKINEIINNELMPVRSQIGTPETQLLGLQTFITSRFPTAKRKDISVLSQFFGLQKFLPKNYASLMDCYWFKEKNKETTWNEVSFFKNYDNDNDPVLALLFFPGQVTRQNLDTNSPNLTLFGDDVRTWYREGDKFYLMYQDAKNIMDNYRVGISFGVTMLPRIYDIYADRLCVKTLMPVSEKVEAISFEDYYLYYKKKMEENDNPEISFINCCEYFDIPGWEEFVDDLSRYDDILEEDSHDLCDIYVLRDTDTLKIIGFQAL